MKISIHALREEGDSTVVSSITAGTISIHALREEGDMLRTAHLSDSIKFLSTPSARRATRITPPTAADYMISIHALREEGDSKNRDKISIFKQIIQHSARI